MSNAYKKLRKYLPAERVAKVKVLLASWTLTDSFPYVNMSSRSYLWKDHWHHHSNLSVSTTEFDNSLYHTVVGLREISVIVMSPLSLWRDSFISLDLNDFFSSTNAELCLLLEYRKVTRLGIEPRPSGHIPDLCQRLLQAQQRRVLSFAMETVFVVFYLHS